MLFYCNAGVHVDVVIDPCREGFDGYTCNTDGFIYTMSYQTTLFIIFCC